MFVDCGQFMESMYLKKLSNAHVPDFWSPSFVFKTGLMSVSYIWHLVHTKPGAKRKKTGRGRNILLMGGPLVLHLPFPPGSHGK